MISNLTEDVELVIKEVLAVRVTPPDHLFYAVNVYIETYLTPIEGKKFPQANQVDVVTVWLVLDDDDNRLSTRVVIALADYTEELLRTKLVETWDAFMIQRMEMKL